MVLDEIEKDHLKRHLEFTFQMQLKKDHTVQDVAEMFIDYGDVNVVKCAPKLYWVDFESFETELSNITPTLLVEKDEVKYEYPINQS